MVGRVTPCAPTAGRGLPALPVAAVYDRRTALTQRRYNKIVNPARSARTGINQMKTRQIILLTLALLAGLRPAVAQTWMKTTAPGIVPNSLASSADGTKLVAVGVSGAVLTSHNSGATWVSNKVGTWNSVASSADGTKLVAVGYGANGVYTSTNSGETWSPTSAPLQNWRAVACSADGNMIVASASISSTVGPIFTSTNSGIDWVSNNLPLQLWKSIASSADGSRLVAVAGGLSFFGPIYSTTNTGVTWTSNNLPRAHWTSVASSADGLKLVAAGNFVLYTSVNGGNIWVSNSMSSLPWGAVASSSDGSKLAAVFFSPGVPGPIYTSTNSGSTWISNNIPVTNWTAVASSADGSKLVAALYGRGVYTAPPEILLGNSISNNNCILSWPSFATGFGLQTNGDVSTTNWSDAGLPVNDDGTNKSVTLPAPASNLFFRLIGN